MLSGLRKVSVSRQQWESVIAGVCFSEMYVIITEDLAAVCVIGVSIIARCPQGKNWLYSDKHSNLFPQVCPLWNFHLLEQSVIINFLPLSSVQSRPRFCIIDTDIFYSDAKWNYLGVILVQKKKLPCMYK